MESINKRGGKRIGAGRPRTIKTVTISFRVPEIWKDEIYKTVNEWIKDLRHKDNESRE